MYTSVVEANLKDPFVLSAVHKIANLPESCRGTWRGSAPPLTCACLKPSGREGIVLKSILDAGFPSRTCIGEWRKSESIAIQISYNTISRRYEVSAYYCTRRPLYNLTCLRGSKNVHGNSVELNRFLDFLDFDKHCIIPGTRYLAVR